MQGMPQGKALDLSQSSAVEGFSNTIQGSNDFSKMKNSDVVIITAGLPRKPGMSRDDLLEINGKIIKKIGLDIHAGHGLTYESAKILAKLKNISEFNIGHFLIGESIFIGLSKSIKKFKKVIK